MRPKILVPAIAWVWALGSALLPGGIAAASRAPVAVVEVRAELNEGDLRDLRDLVTIVPGRALSPGEVRRTIRNLHAAGLASEVEVLSEARPEGQVAIIVLSPVARIRELRFQGELGVSRSALRRRLEVQPGERLIEGNLLRSVYALQDFLEKRGYRRAGVFLRVERLEGRGLRVVFEVDAGTRTQVGAVSVEGLPADLASLRPRFLATRSGRAFDWEQLAEDRERLRELLSETGYPSATVDEVEIVDRSDSSVDIVFTAHPGARIDLEIRGMEERELRKQGLLDFLGSEGFDEALVLRSVARIQRYLQTRGHYRARVEPTMNETESGTRLVLDIDKGEVYRVDRVTFVGNERVGSDVLRDLVTTRPRLWSVPGSGRLVDEVLRADLENLRSYYRLQGYGSVEIGEPTVEQEGTSLSLAIPIVEGRRQRVVSVQLRGVRALDVDDLLASLPLSAGGPFHGRLLEESRVVLRNAYSQAGYAEVEIESRQDWDEQHALVDVLFDVEEGWRSILDRVVIRGQRKTRTALLRRELGLEVGDPVSSELLLEAQRKLYSMGLFSRVDVDLLSSPEDPSERDLLVKVREAPPRRLTYGFGYNSDEGFGGLLGWSHANFFGRAHSFSADLRLTTSNNRRYRLLYNQPTSGAWLQPMRYMLFFFEEDRPGYEVDSFGGQVIASWQHRRLRWGARYDYRIVEPFNISVPISEIERELQQSQIASATGFLHWDRRDRPVDPTQGTSTRLEMELAKPMLSATSDYAKVFLEHSVHWNLDGLGKIAANFRLGGIEPLGNVELWDPGVDVCTDPSTLGGQLPPPTAAIPIVERFFGGGRTTHRAFERDLLGICGQTLSPEGDPTGGNGLLLLNLDYRFPVAGPVEGIVFVDAGNIWADWRLIRVPESRLGAGLGARYLSPLGPLRLEVGWKLDREHGESAKAFFLSFGDPF